MFPVTLPTLLLFSELVFFLVYQATAYNGRAGMCVYDTESWCGQWPFTALHLHTLLMLCLASACLYCCMPIAQCPHHSRLTAFAHQELFKSSACLNRQVFGCVPWMLLTNAAIVLVALTTCPIQTCLSDHGFVLYGFLSFNCPESTPVGCLSLGARYNQICPLLLCLLVFIITTTMMAIWKIRWFHFSNNWLQKEHVPV
jgi:hypothetical protein